MVPGGQRPIMVVQLGWQKPVLVSQTIPPPHMPDGRQSAWQDPAHCQGAWQQIWPGLHVVVPHMTPAAPPMPPLGSQRPLLALQPRSAFMQGVPVRQSGTHVPAQG